DVHVHIEGFFVEVGALRYETVSGEDDPVEGEDDADGKTKIHDFGGLRVLPEDDVQDDGSQQHDAAANGGAGNPGTAFLVVLRREGIDEAAEGVVRFLATGRKGKS